MTSISHDHDHDDHDHDHDHDHHGHEHGHDHEHDPIEEGAALRVRALEELMIAKGLVKPEAIDRVIDYYERQTGPRNGAAVVARAWTDPDFKQWLLRDGTAAIHSMGFKGYQGEHMRVVENTDKVHHVIVCTLCSCYPWPILGLPPAWYKGAAYRSRVVREPRAVLQEFGLTLSPDKEVRVWDSTAEIRFMVLPQRPPETQGMTVEQLADLVTRDGMIGTAIL